jgi:hypothetical protein
MKLKLVAAISAFVAIPALTHAQQGGPPPSVSEPTKADVEKVVQIVTSDEAKTQSYCDLNKLYDQLQAGRFPVRGPYRADHLGGAVDRCRGGDHEQRVQSRSSTTRTRSAPIPLISTSSASRANGLA